MYTSAIFALLACVCAATSGFTSSDFDSYFNDFSEQDVTDAFQYMTAPNDHHRFTRNADARANSYRPLQCCGTAPITLTDEEKQDMISCKVQTGPENVPGENRGVKLVQRFACSSDCLGHKKKLVDSEGFVKLDYFKAAYLARFNDPSLKDVNENSIDECVPLMNQKAKEAGIVEVDGKSCNSAFGFAVMCVGTKTEMNCPEGKQVKSAACEEKRKKMKEWADKVKQNS